jgi:hypothetical protein
MWKGEGPFLTERSDDAVHKLCDQTLNLVAKLQAL